MKTDSSILVPLSRQPPHETLLSQIALIVAMMAAQEGTLLWILKGHFCLLWSCLTLFSFYGAWLSSNPHRIWQTDFYKIPGKEWFLLKHKLQISWNKLNLALTWDIIRWYLLFLFSYFIGRFIFFVTWFDLLQFRMWYLRVGRQTLHSTC